MPFALDYKLSLIFQAIAKQFAWFVTRIPVEPTDDPRPQGDDEVGLMPFGAIRHFSIRTQVIQRSCPVSIEQSQTTG